MASSQIADAIRAERKAGKTSDERADAGSEEEDDQVKWHGEARQP